MTPLLAATLVLLLVELVLLAGTEISMRRNARVMDEIERRLRGLSR